MDPTDASTVSIATRTTTSYALTFASWKETEKWDGRSMGKKSMPRSLSSVALTERRCAQESAVDATASVLSGTDRAEMCCKQSKSANEHQKVRTSTKKCERALRNSQGERPVVSASAQHRVKQSGRLALRARGEWRCQCHGVCPLRHAPSGDMAIHDLMLN